MKRLSLSFMVLSVLFSGCMSSDYRRGYAQGVAEANAEISKKTLTIYIHGEPPYPIPKNPKDEKTGLPLRWIAACIVTQFDMGRHDGHNSTILKWLEKSPSVLSIP